MLGRNRGDISLALSTLDRIARQRVPCTGMGIVHCTVSGAQRVQ
jgi:hypothetical protein